MLENVVAWVLNNYIGEYLENLNTDQLSFAILSGQLELENVPLKKTALQKFDIPLEIKNGVLGKLTLSIPLTRMRSEPWVLKLSDVLIIVGPKSQQRYDVESTEQTEQTKKELMLNELEMKHCKQLLDTMGKPSATVDEQESWWGASILATVANNIQLILTNVHVRYEDDRTLPNGLSFTCGFRIQKMTMHTTNHHWKPGFVEPQDGVNVFKKLDLQGFSFYWNSNQPVSKNVSTIKDIQNFLSPEDAQSNTYIIEPCGIELRMEKNASKLPLKGNPPVPRFKFWLKQEKIVVELSRRQMSELRALNREWSRYERARLHRKWRPLSGIAENAKEWWRFACNRIVDEKKRADSRRTWSFALTRAHHLNAYARAYRRRLLVLINNQAARTLPEASTSIDPNRPTLGTEERTIMKQIERDDQYTFSELHLFRETVFRKLLREKELEMGLVPEILSDERTGGTDTPPEEQFESLESPLEEVAMPEGMSKGQGVYGWLTSFFTGKEKEPSLEEPSFDFGHIDLQELKNVPPAFKEIEKQVEEEILDVLHNSWDDSTILRKDFLLAEVALKLERLTLRFVDGKATTRFDDRRILAVDLIQVTSRIQLSPRTHTLDVSLSVHDMSIQRLITTCKRHREESIQNLDLNDSLMYSNNENTKVLLAIGRGTQSTDLSKPLFKMQYRRRSPRLIVRHIIEGTFRPISLMCDENALHGIGSLFEDDPEIMFSTNAIAPIDKLDDASAQQALNNLQTTSINVESHVFMDLNLPNICLVLRKKEWETCRTPKANLNVEQFAKLNIDDAHLSIISREQFVHTVSIDVGHMDIQDMFENTTYPLLSTKKTRDLKTLSLSCPDLRSTGENVDRFSTSLPNDGFLSSISTNHLNANLDRPAPLRKTSAAVKRGSTKESMRTTSETWIKCTLINSKHPEFESRFGRKNCSIEISFNEVELGMNRRSWTAIMDFVGILGVNEEDLRAVGPVPGLIDARKELSEDMREIQVTEEPWQIACSLHIKTLRINMNYPSNGTRLGVILFQELDLLNTIHLRDLREQIRLSLTFLGMRVTDRTPGYSALYDERLALTSENALQPLPVVQLNILKYLGDVDPSRDHDLMIQLIIPKQMHLYYVHTHRYFCAIMDFWMNFFELQDHIIKQKKKYVTEGLKTRVKLDIDIQSPSSIILPQNQLSDEVIVLKTSEIRIANTFKPSSNVISTFKEYGVIAESDYDSRFANIDCLLDCIKINFLNLEIHEGKRVERIFFKEEPGSFPLGRDVFEHFEFTVSERTVFNERFDLVADVYRNLESNLSKNVPDLTIITGIQGVTWQLTTDFYCLLRGFLLNNLADALIPLPETIPIELLERPEYSCEVGSENKYVTLALRIIFEKVVVDCLVPKPSTLAKTRHSRVTGVVFNRKYDPFARSHLPNAKVSFDVYIDGMAEFNLISYNMQLEDRRPVPPTASSQVLHNIICTPIDSKNASNPVKVMTEAAIVFMKDQPPSISLVLQGARVIVAPDFLFDAKDFILLVPEFNPPMVDQLLTEEPKRINAANFVNCGVIDRLSVNTDPQEQTFELKVTLKETDLYFLENAWSVKSSALILATEAVLKMNDQKGNLSIALEVSSIHVDWCLMDALPLTRSQCTNAFKLSTKLFVEEKQKPINGLPLLLGQRHILEVEVSNTIGKISLKDARALKKVLEGWVSHWNATSGKSLMPIQSFRPVGKAIEISKTFVSASRFELWILDDVQKDGCMPMLRCILNDVILERSNERLVTSFTINLDYFNQCHYGWEPFIEQWRILRFHMCQKKARQSFELITETKSTLDINLTKDFIQLAMYWKTRFLDAGLEFGQLSKQQHQQPLATEIAITMRSGIGISIVNESHEELIYARLSDIVINASIIDSTFQVSGSAGVIQVDNQLLNGRWPFLYCQAPVADDEAYPLTENFPAGVPTTALPALKIEINCRPMQNYDAFDCFRLKLSDLSIQMDEVLLWKLVQFYQATMGEQVKPVVNNAQLPEALAVSPNKQQDQPDTPEPRKCYFGTLEIAVGQISLTVATIPTSGLPRDLRLLKQEFNIMLVSFENAGINFPIFRQINFFDTSAVLLELLKKFYYAELQKQAINVAFYLDAFGNPAGFVTDLKDSFTGLIIEGDVRGFVSGVGHGVSNSISKVASSMAAGVGSLTFDEEHEAKRRHNMLRSQSSSSASPLSHLYSGVKGLGMGFMGILTSIPINTVQESKKSGVVTGTIRGVSTGVVDMVTKPVQGLFDLVDGTASAVRELAAPLTVKRPSALNRIRLPRACTDVCQLLPPYDQLLAFAQMEMLRINGHNQAEKLLAVELLIEQLTMEEVQRQYVLITNEQCYVCKQINDESWIVLKTLAYKHVKSIHELDTLYTLFPVEVMEEEDYSKAKPYHIWCARKDVAERVTSKLLRAKKDYDERRIKSRKKDARFQAHDII